MVQLLHRAGLSLDVGLAMTEMLQVTLFHISVNMAHKQAKSGASCQLRQAFLRQPVRYCHVYARCMTDLVAAGHHDLRTSRALCLT